MKTRNYIAGSLTPLALAVAISTALADTAANTMSPAPAMTPPAGPVAGTAGTMPEPAPVAPPAPGPSDATFSSAALSSGQSALPLVAVPAVASAGLADTRNAASANVHSKFRGTSWAGRHRDGCCIRRAERGIGCEGGGT